MPRTKQLFADDLAVGFVFRGEATALTPEHFSQFAALTGDSRFRPYLPDVDDRWRGTELGKELERALARTTGDLTA